MNTNTPHFLQLTGDFPEGQLIPKAIFGYAAISELYCYQVDCIISGKKDEAGELAQLDSYINTFAQIQVHAPDQNTLIINGIIDQLHINLSDLTAVLYISPTIKLLEKSLKSEIYTQSTTRQIIKKILNDTQINQKPYFDLKITQAEDSELSTINYIAQFNESNLHFLLRVASYSKFLFYFLFEPEKHILSLTHNLSLIVSKVRYSLSLSKKKPYAIYSWQLATRLTSDAITLSDVDPENPFHSIKANHGNSPETIFQEFSSGLNNAAEGDLRMEVEMNRMRSKKKIFIGKTHSTELHPGLVIDIDGTKYLVISTFITAKSHDDNHQTSNFFECEFKATREINQFKDANCYKKPSCFGIHSGRIENESQKPISLNTIGSVNASLDFNSSDNSYQGPRMRVMQSSAGGNHGHVFIPRHGNEVWISYLNGNMDRPIIIGCAYNSTNTPSYTLPLEKSTSGIKHTSASSKGEMLGQYNELSFNNESGEEAITLKAQKNYSEIVENDSLYKAKGCFLNESQLGNIEHIAHNGAASIIAKKSILFQCGQSTIGIKENSITLNSPQIALNPKSVDSGNRTKSTLLSHKNHIDSIYSMLKEDANISA